MTNGKDQPIDITDKQNHYLSVNADSGGSYGYSLNDSLVSHQLTEKPGAIVLSKQKHDGFQLRITNLKDNYNVMIRPQDSLPSNLDKSNNPPTDSYKGVSSSINNDSRSAYQQHFSLGTTAFLYGALVAFFSTYIFIVRNLWL